MGGEDDGRGGAAAGRVSIVVPVYNTRPYLRECIDSALGQSHPDVEVVAVDGGSTDGSLELLKEYGDAIRVVSLPGSGISEALNAGICEMSGEWFKRLDSDDVLLPGAASALVAAAERAGAGGRGGGPARFVPYMDAETVGEDGSLLCGATPFPSGPLTNLQQGALMLCEAYGMPIVSLIHRSVFDDIGMFDERYGIGEDWEFGLRLTIRGGYRMLHVPKTLYRYRRRGGQTTGSWIRVLRQLGRVGRDWMEEMEPGMREEYAEECKRFLRARLFLFGAWACANRGSNAAQAMPGAGTGASGGVVGSIGRHWLARLAYNAVRARSVLPCVRGWAYAARNPKSELVARCRGRPIGACTNIMRLGFGPPGEGGLDAGGLPRLVVPWEAPS